MRRGFYAFLLGAIAAAAVALEASPRGTTIRGFLAMLLAGNELPRKPVKVTAIEVNAKSLHPLEAALVLRAVLRYSPPAIGFFLPLDEGAGDPLLISKLRDVKVPLVLAGNESVVPMPDVRVAEALPALPRLKAWLPPRAMTGCVPPSRAGQVAAAARQDGKAVPSTVWRLCMALEGVAPGAVKGSIPGEIVAGTMAVPVDAAGFTSLNPLGAAYVNRISLDELLLQTERGERGVISPLLENRLRGRVVVVEAARGGGAIAVATIRNHLASRPTSLILGSLGVLLAVTLPWWGMGRINRAIAAAFVSCLLVLLAMSLYDATHVPLPLFAITLLPLLAPIPPARLGGRGACPGDRSEGEIAGSTPD